MSEEAQTALPQDDPLMIAWNRYKASDGFANSKRWALRLRPHSDETSEILTLAARQTYVDGALWAAFVDGYRSAKP